MKHIFSARVYLHRLSQEERCGYWITADRKAGKSIGIGFPIGHAPHWYESRWEFDDPMIVRGTTFIARFRLLHAEQFDEYFTIGTDFDLLQGGACGFHVIGHGVVLSIREIEKGESLTWPSKSPSLHLLEPDSTLPALLRESGKPSESTLALADKLECLAKLPSCPSQWFLSDEEYALVEQIKENRGRSVSGDNSKK